MITVTHSRKPPLPFKFQNLRVGDFFSIPEDSEDILYMKTEKSYICISVGTNGKEIAKDCIPEIVVPYDLEIIATKSYYR